MTRYTSNGVAVGARVLVSVSDDDDDDDDDSNGWRSVGDAMVVSLVRVGGSIVIRLRALDLDNPLIPPRLDAVEGEPDTWTAGARWYRIDAM